MYLLIDRGTTTVIVFSEPKDGRYLHAPTYPWGSRVEFADPVGFTLDTED